MDILDLFGSPVNLLASAHGHIAEVTELLKTVLDNQQQGIIEEIDPDTGDHIHKAKLSAIMPPQAPVRVFNAATEIRAALDHAVYAASVLLGERPDPSRTGFAFGDDVVTFEAEVKKRCAHVPLEVLAVMRDLKPYKGGNETLWRLNKLRNVKDHRRLLLPEAVVFDMRFHGEVSLTEDYAGPHPPKIQWQPVVPLGDNEFPVLRIPHGMRAKYDLDFSVAIVFGEPKEIQKLPVTDFLNSALDESYAALNAFIEVTARTLNARAV